MDNPGVILLATVVVLGTAGGLLLHFFNQWRESQNAKRLRTSGFAMHDFNQAKPASTPSSTDSSHAACTGLMQPTGLPLSENTPLPTARIDPKQHVAPGTGFHSSVGWLLLPVAVLLTALGTYGMALIAWLVAGVLYSYRVKIACARLHGSALIVSEKQFPEVYHAAINMTARLGMADCPEIYIAEDNQQNAFALKHGSKKLIVLIDDVVFGALATGNTNVLHFIVGHELAHHALGHTHMLRSVISSYYHPLSRLDEFSCDTVAHALVGDTAAARDALILLLAGPQLFRRVDRQALDQQVFEVVADKYSKISERGLSHPLLLRRYARLCEPHAR